MASTQTDQNTTTTAPAPPTQTTVVSSLGAPAASTAPGAATTGATGFGVLFTSPAAGAPTVGAPNPSNYEIPNSSALSSAINALYNTPAISPDLSQYNASVSTQQSLLSNLQGIANGSIATQAETQGQTALQNAQAQSLGSAVAAGRGGNALLALRSANVNQTTQTAQIMQTTEQLSAQQQITAQQQAATVSGQIASESLQAQQLTLQGQEATFTMQQSAIGDALDLSGMQQNASIAYQTAQTNYQEYTQQTAISVQSHNQASVLGWIATGLTAVGGAAATFFTAGAAAPAAAAATVAVGEATGSF